MNESNKNLEYYKIKFSKIKRGVTKYGPAPHKAVLLLSIIQGVEKGYITSNVIKVTPMLVSIFKSTWKLLVKTGHSANFSLPFFT